jgi:rRNA maturation protein Nop10
VITTVISTSYRRCRDCRRVTADTCDRGVSALSSALYRADSRHRHLGDRGGGVTVILRCPRCGQSAEVLIPVQSAFCGRCAVPLVREEKR